MNATDKPITKILAKTGEFLQVETAQGLLVEVDPSGGTIGVFKSRPSFDAGENPLIGVVAENAGVTCVVYENVTGEQTIERRR